MSSTLTYFEQGCPLLASEGINVRPERARRNQTCLSDLLNDRQAKVIDRMFGEGTNGFKGGLSAENYITITEAARATATRDLQALVAMGALRKEGELKYTRYYLEINL